MSAKGKKKAKVRRNFVAKHAAQFHRAAVHRQKKKYRRKQKHKGKIDD